MNVQQAYNQWSENYDAVENKTRDLDVVALKQTLAHLKIGSVLEIGCGTGKNTVWLAQHARQVTAVDFAESMLQKAKEKTAANNTGNITFITHDITQAWTFENVAFDLITTNLVLEHIKNLDFIFSEAHKVLIEGGLFFISELHPFKQYTGSKARFEANNTLIMPDAFVHHVSEFFNSATTNGFICLQLNEWFDDGEKESIPRLISFLFQKK